MRIAVASVSGSRTARSTPPSRNNRSNGAEPAACTTATRGRASIKPAAYSSRKPFPKALILPKLPPGNTIQSGTRHPRCSSISMTIDFWPSIRNGFTELRR